MTSKTRKRGGKPINSGGYGCIFKPALRCKGKKRPVKGSVSKLMTKETARREMDLVHRIDSKVREIPNYNKYFFTKEFESCTPDRLTKSDLVGFSRMCQNFKNSGMTARNVNLHLDKLETLTMPDGGEDLSGYLRSVLLTRRLFEFLNNSLVSVINNAVIPMNNLGVYHLDLKATNVMVTPDDRLKLIDWGISVIHESNIPRTLEKFPIVFNLPYSSILFNSLFQPYYSDVLKRNPILLNGSREQNDNLRNAIVDYLYLINREIGQGHLKYISIMMARIYLPLVFTHQTQYSSDFISGLTTDRIVEYIAPILRRFTVNSKFDSAGYLKVFSKNVDIWGMITCYDAFMPAIQPARNDKLDPLYIGIRNVFIDFLFRNPDLEIDTGALSTRLRSLNELKLSTRQRSKRTRKHRSTPRRREYTFEEMTITPTPGDSPISTSTRSLPSLYTGSQLNNLFSR